MALNFDYTECCNGDKAAIDALTTHPGDPEKWHPVGDSLVWLSMFCGFNRITADKVDDIWKRIDLYQRVCGSIYWIGQGEPLMLTREDVQRYVGLRTNASPKTTNQFHGFIIRCAYDKNGPRGSEVPASAFDRVAQKHANQPKPLGPPLTNPDEMNNAA